MTWTKPRVPTDIELVFRIPNSIMQRNSILKMACLFKNRFIEHRFPAHSVILLSSVIFLFFTASDSYSLEPLDSDIAKALRKVVKCEKIEIKTKADDKKSGK